MRINSIIWQNGELVTIFGENGIGKSSFVETLTGSCPAPKGSIHHNFDHISYLPQNISLNKLMPLKVRDFIDLYHLHTHCRDENHKIFDLFGIHKLLNNSIHDLSGGEFKRLMLGCQLLNQSKCLILDEPLMAMDQSIIDEFLEYLLYYKQKFQPLMIVISHRWELFLPLTDRLYAIKNKALQPATQPLKE